MAKVYGIYGDNKCKREINTYIGQSAFSKPTLTRGNVWTIFTGLKQGLYLIIGTISATASYECFLDAGAYDVNSEEKRKTTYSLRNGENCIGYSGIVNIGTDGGSIKASIQNIVKPDGSTSATVKDISANFELIRLV